MWFIIYLLIYDLQINVTVSTVECDLDFAIQPNTIGKNLFDQVFLNFHKIYDWMITIILTIVFSGQI